MSSETSLKIDRSYADVTSPGHCRIQAAYTPSLLPPHPPSLQAEASPRLPGKLKTMTRREGCLISSWASWCAVRIQLRHFIFPATPGSQIPGEAIPIGTTPAQDLSFSALLGVSSPRYPAAPKTIRGNRPRPWGSVCIRLPKAEVLANFPLPRDAPHIISALAPI